MTTHNLKPAANKRAVKWCKDHGYEPCGDSALIKGTYWITCYSGKHGYEIGFSECGNYRQTLRMPSIDND